MFHRRFGPRLPKLPVRVQAQALADAAEHIAVLDFGIGEEPRDLGPHDRSGRAAPTESRGGYEEQVTNPEAVGRKAVAGHKLDWDKCFLAYYRSRWAVSRASQLQMRHPFYFRFEGCWNRFQARLEPLHLDLGVPGSSPQN